jgi:hypothetical protein
MKNWRQGSAINALAVIAAAAVFVLVSATSLRAQIAPNGTGPGLSGRDRDINQREADIANLERGSKPGEKRDPQMILAEVNEDFSRLREIDEDLKVVLSSKNALDYKHIAESAAEVKKRATRLKANLTLSAVKDDKRQKIQNPGDDLKPSLTTLEGLISSFLKNPIFSDTGALDNQMAGRAKHDLDDMLELSEKLRKSAEKMSKNAGKT